MVNVSKTPFGGYAIVLGGGPGNYTGYGHTGWREGSSPLSYFPQYRERTSSATKRRNTYYARQLQTTNLSAEYRRLPTVSNIPYIAHAQVHQGQLRSRRTQLYNFPNLADTPSSATTLSPSSEHTKKDSKTSVSRKISPHVVKRRISQKPFVLPEIAKRTAGKSTLDTASHPGFAKGFAASRADSGSLVNTLRGNKQTLHCTEESDGKVGSVPDIDRILLVPYGLEEYNYTTLENLKKKRLQDTYFGIMENHKKNRMQIVKRKIQLADQIKRRNLYADHATSTILGIRRHEPIRIPTATMDDADYFIDHSDKPKTLKAVEQARKNISESYLNVWNSKRQY
ncbi:uncharacterized protein LOC120328831 [Styela clava]